MGTNYYRIKPITEEQRQELHNKLDDVLDNRSQKWELEEALEAFEKEHQTHICKFSAGWQVCFDHNLGKFYQPNRKSLEKFLSEKGTWIEDEYGVRFSYEYFWDYVKKHNDNPRNKWTSESYRKWEEETNGRRFTNYCLDDIERCKMMFGINSNGETDFTVDGLRFAVYSDFS